jgi:hypothetical protein
MDLIHLVEQKYSSCFGRSISKRGIETDQFRYLCNSATQEHLYCNYKTGQDLDSSQY